MRRRCRGVERVENSSFCLFPAIWNCGGNVALKSADVAIDYADARIANAIHEELVSSHYTPNPDHCRRRPERRHFVTLQILLNVFDVFHIRFRVSLFTVYTFNMHKPLADVQTNRDLFSGAVNAVKFTAAGTFAVPALGAAAAAVALMSRTVFVVVNDARDWQEVRRVVFAAHRPSPQAEPVKALDCSGGEGGADNGAIHRESAFKFHRTAEVFRFNASN